MTRRALQFATVFAVAAGLALSGLRVHAQCPKEQATAKATAAKMEAPAAQSNVLRQQRREVLIEELGLPLGLLAEYALDGE